MQHLQRQLGVADHRVVRRDVLVDVHRIDGVVDEHLVVGRKADAETGGGETGAGAEDDIGILHALEYGLGHRNAA